MTLMALVMAFMAGTTAAGLCDLAPDEAIAPRIVDLEDNWQDCYLGCFLSTSPEHSIPLWGPARGWDVAPLWTRVAGDDVDRRWYAYLDRGRYRFLDVTQYTLLDGPAGLWSRWRYRAGLDAMNLSWSASVRLGFDEPQVIPEPATVTLLALGALVALRRR
jgi:hypothetical protein